MIEEEKILKKGFSEGEAAEPDIGPEITPVEADPQEELPRPSEEDLEKERGLPCPLMVRDRIGGITCFYGLQEIGACDPGRCGYFRELVVAGCITFVGGPVNGAEAEIEVTYDVVGEGR